ncbi:periplasmic-type flagellar collar protein FlbB [Borreliella yangtzensis]|uniref:Flagellar protein FlbB n=1 Tax=Borreliella yangtzensis TaxID=683292 RepID=A0ABR6P9J9_9SPIR|nr:flagellar protein [Borreliella yangtzensis]MBB6042958.1 flagellar protein FlbB [Borreliella yangtzensis]WKC73266.1 flagellar protein [Borreliella yangtzensis]WKC74184.1 flagellar protein [Borreliella yangtzensis]
MNNFLSFFFRAFFLLFLIVILFLFVLFSIDFLGMYNTKRYFPEFVRTKFLGETSLVFDHNSNIILDETRLVKEREAIDIKNQQIEKLKEDLKLKEDSLNKLEFELKQKQKDLDLKQKVIDDIINKYNDEEANILQTAVYLMNMPPEDAVKRLEDLNPELAISYMRKIEELSKKEDRISIVPYWLSLMDAKKAAILIRKMSVSSLE